MALLLMKIKPKELSCIASVLIKFGRQYKSSIFRIKRINPGLHPPVR
jgi:hypothetical protein